MLSSWQCQPREGKIIAPWGDIYIYIKCYIKWYIFCCSDGGKQIATWK